MGKRKNRALDPLAIPLLALVASFPAFAGDPVGTPAANIGQGDVATALPGVDRICAVIRNAQDGIFLDKDNREATFTKDECMTKPRRERNLPGCQTTMSQLIGGLTGDAREKKIDELCAATTGTLTQAAAANCAIRTIAKDGQTVQYCEAYRSADKAQKGLKWVLALDVSAAGLCWTEYLTTKAQIAAGKASLQATGMKSVFQSGLCGGASMAAGVGELMQTVKVVSGAHSAGEMKIDGDNNVKDRNDFLKTFEVVGSAVLSLKAIQVSVCYFKANLPICKGLKEKTFNAKNNAKSTDYLNGKIADAMDYDDAQGWKDVDKSQKMVMRKDLALESAKIFTTLSAMRGVAMASAGATKRKASEILQSMFTGGSNHSTLAASGITTGGTGIFNLVGNGAYSPTGETQPNQNAAIAAGSPESFLAPPGSAQNQAATELARRIPEKKLDEAVAGGSSGIGGLIGSTVSGGDASDRAKIQGVAATAFANLPKEEGGYGGSGGAKMASKGDAAAGDLNLKSLFGAAEKEERTTTGGDLAYRAPASDDIWHSRNPKGNNLFQIISDRYDTAQRKDGLSPSTD